MSRVELLWDAAIAAASAGTSADLIKTSTPLAPETAVQWAPGNGAPPAAIASLDESLRLDRNESANGRRRKCSRVLPVTWLDRLIEWPRATRSSYDRRRGLVRCSC
jgi:hypothetical protein